MIVILVSQLNQQFQLSDEEGIYGLGQHQYGYFNYRNPKN